MNVASPPLQGRVVWTQAVRGRWFRRAATAALTKWPDSSRERLASDVSSLHKVAGCRQRQTSTGPGLTRHKVPTQCRLRVMKTRETNPVEPMVKRETRKTKRKTGKLYSDSGRVYLPHGTVTCRGGAGRRSHPHPQQQRASGGRGSREMPL